MFFNKFFGYGIYGYAACEVNGKWRLIKITQFPKPSYEVIGDGFNSAEEAMKESA